MKSLGSELASNFFFAVLIVAVAALVYRSYTASAAAPASPSGEI